MVSGNSIAEEAGLEFADQIIAINGTSPTSMSTSEAGKAISTPQSIRLIVRKPLNITLHRDEAHSPWGIAFRNGTVINAILAGSPADQAHLPCAHSILGIGHVSTIGLSDDAMGQLLGQPGYSVVLKLRPVDVYRYKKKSFNSLNHFLVATVTNCHGRVLIDIPCFRELLSCLGLRITSKKSKFDAIFPPAELKKPNILDLGESQGNDQDQKKKGDVSVRLISDRVVPSPPVSASSGFNQIFQIIAITYFSIYVLLALQRFVTHKIH